MRLCEILAEDRILVDSDGGAIQTKSDALRLMARMLAPAVDVEPAEVERLLADREKLQSTGIGDGVAIPHASADTAARQAAALLLCPRGVPFDAIDGENVTIIFGVLGPRRATGEHLRTLARISRLLRDESTRTKLKTSAGATEAFRFIEAHEEAMG